MALHHNLIERCLRGALAIRVTLRFEFGIGHLLCYYGVIMAVSGLGSLGVRSN